MISLQRRVLMIAYYFPPLGLSGVQRTVKFAKYLPHYGWLPTVLTVAPTGYYALDNSLLEEVERAGVEIVRTDSLDVNRLFRRRGVVRMPSERARKFFQFVGDAVFIPDTKIGWKRNALKAARTLLTERQFDVLFATAPPQTDFLIGRDLKRQFGLPLVLDYRDAWLDYPFKYYPTPLHTYLHYRLEKSVLRAADRVIVTHRRVKESLLRRYRFLAYNDVVILPQGFDPDDLVVASAASSAPHRMRIAHTGTFYAGRTPNALLMAMHNLFTTLPHLRTRIELVLIGVEREEDRRLVRRLGLEDAVTFIGYVDHRECVQHLLSSDVLYFVTDNDYQSPGKLYEYIGTRKPILASAVDGYMKQLIRESGAGECIPLNDVAAHGEALLMLFHQFEQRKLKQIPEDFASRFNRALLTKDLAREFELLLDVDRHHVVEEERKT